MSPFFENFFQYLNTEKNYSAHTLEAYKRDLAQFHTFLTESGNTSNLLEVSPGMIRQWVVGLMENHSAPTSVRRKVSAVKSFYQYLLLKGKVKSNPAAKSVLPKTPKRLPNFVEKEEINQLLNDLFLEATSWEEEQEALILELFYLTGIRLSELIELKQESIDFSTGQMRVSGKGNKERLIPLMSATVQKLMEFKKKVNGQQMSPIDYLFVTKKGNKLYPQFVYRIVKKCLSKVTGLSKKSPHVLRHTFATHMLNNGADINSIKTLLGHESLAATQVYTHNTISKLKGVHKQAHPRG